MVTRRGIRVAGVAALVTGLLFTAAVLVFGGGPGVDTGGALTAWFADELWTVRIASILWIHAAFGMVVFAVTLRESMWAHVVDRSWVTQLFVQGAAVFAAVAVAAAAVGWGLAELAHEGAVEPGAATAMWAIGRMLLRFAVWGLIPPLLIVGFALARHSLLGEIATVAGLFVAAALLFPSIMQGAILAFAAWLALTGVALLHPFRVPLRLRRRPKVPADLSSLEESGD